MFLVVQDELQLKKICENVDLENFITVFYAGRRITNISSSGVSNWLLFVLSFFKREDRFWFVNMPIWFLE